MSASVPADAREPPARWSELAQGGRALTFTVLCLGVWLNAVDTLVASTIMPSVAREVGGYPYFSWATAGYLLGSILAGSGAGLLGERLGLRSALAASGLLYGLGCALSALAGSIWPFLAGRLVQGLGAGFVVGLCYVAVRAAFPQRLWSAVFAALSAVWGVATLLGPLVGGVFAGLHQWRAVFWLFAIQAVAFAILVRTLPRRGAGEGARPGFPARQLAVMALGVVLVAVAGVSSRAAVSAVLAAAGLVTLALVLRIDRSARTRLLPTEASDLASRPGQGYAMQLTLSAAAIAFSVYGAALLQARLGLSPLQAGYVIASESVGWTVTALLVAKAEPARHGFFIRLGAGLVALGLAGCAATLSRLGAGWVAASGLIMGGGFGLCWSFAAQRVLAALPESEAAIGSAAVPLMQMLGNALGSAGAGVIANLLGFASGFRADTAAQASPILLGSFVPVALLGVAAAWRLGRGADMIPSPSMGEGQGRG